MIKGKTPAEIRRTFNIINDFTPEEEAQVQEENKCACATRAGCPPCRLSLRRLQLPCRLSLLWETVTTTKTTTPTPHPSPFLRRVRGALSAQSSYCGHA